MRAAGGSDTREHTLGWELEQDHAAAWQAMWTP